MFDREAKIQIGLLLGPALLAGLLQMLLIPFGIYGFLSILIAGFGIRFVLRAKMSEKKRTNKLISWGYGEMTANEKKDYFIGQAMILFYIVFSIYLLLNSALHGATSL